MIRIRDIILPAEHNPEQLVFEAAKMLKLTGSQIRRLQIVRRSIDARKKPDVRYVYTVDVAVDGREDKVIRRSGCKKAAVAPVYKYKVPRAANQPQLPPVVVGFGPAGMFAALVLAMAGLNPIVLERGEDALTRKAKVEHFFATGELDEKTNVQFGEGGAGTFSDGKLNTGVNNPRIGWVLEQFVRCGAGEDILYDAKPHVGTDVLVDVVQNLRRRIIALGGTVRFRAHVTGLEQSEGRLTGLVLADGEIVPCSHAIFAIGHSSRDTFAMLHEMDIPMEPKPFAMGVRIEHKQSMVDESQYGASHPALPPADYKLVEHLEDGTVYTFCMCPGGYVVAAASEEGRLVTNGMSYSDRAGENANAALLVTLNPRQFPYPGPLGGVQWQRELEERAFLAGGSNYFAPAQRVGDFLAHCPSTGPGKVQPTYRPGVAWTDLHSVLPPQLTEPLEQALPKLDNRLRGFADADAVLTAVESRSSSPVRILRGEDRQTSLRGLYPTGEGAGYAGGIMSAAIDGILSAEALLESL